MFSEISLFLDSKVDSRNQALKSLHTTDTGVYRARFCAKGFTQRWADDCNEAYSHLSWSTSRFEFCSHSSPAARKQKLIRWTLILYSIPLQHAGWNRVHQPARTIRCAWQRGLYLPLMKSTVWIKAISMFIVAHYWKSTRWLQIQTTQIGSLYLDRQKCEGEGTYFTLYVDRWVTAVENEKTSSQSRKIFRERFEWGIWKLQRSFLAWKSSVETLDRANQSHIQQLFELHGMRNRNYISAPLNALVKVFSSSENDAAADPMGYYSRMVRGLMFAAYVTRPDIACVVSQLPQFFETIINNMHTAKNPPSTSGELPPLESSTVFQ